MDAPPPYPAGGPENKYAPPDAYPQQGYPPPAPGAYQAAPGAYPPAPGAYPPAPGAYPPPAPGAYPPAGAYGPQVTQPGAIVVQQVPQQRPPDNLILSVIACFFCNGFCLGLAALICAYQSQQDANASNMEEARRKGETAKKLAIAAIVVSAIAITISVIVRIVLTALYTPY